MFVRFALMPGIRSSLSEEEQDRVRASVGKRWKMMVHTSILLLLVSGFYNYLVVSLPAHEGHALYNALLGGKMLLAFVVFFLVIAVTSSGLVFQGMRAKAPALTLLAVLLGIAIVLMAGFANRLENAPVEVGVEIGAPGSEVTSH